MICPKCHNSSNTLKYLGNKMAKCTGCGTICVIQNEEYVPVEENALDEPSKEILKKHNESEETLNEPKTGKGDILIGIMKFLFFGGLVFILFGFIALFNSSRETSPIVYCLPIGIVMASIPVVYFIGAFIWAVKEVKSPYSYSSNDSTEKSKYELARLYLVAEEEKYKKLLEFYAECAKNFDSLDNEKNIERAKLIQSKYSCLAGMDLYALYDEAKAVYGVESNEKNKEIRSAEIEKEKSLQNELLKYLKYQGREKRIKMLSDIERGLYDKALSINHNTANLQSGSKALMQKETDWAVMGGIANGIAGPAAGLAAALDTQAKNAEIRSNNANINRTVAMATIKNNERADKLKNEASTYSEMINSTMTKLVSNDDSDTCFGFLSLSQSHINVSETGTCTVSVKASVNKPIIIYDDVVAVVDGSIKAEIYDEDTCIGSCYMVLPIYGVGENETIDLFGMAIACGDKVKETSYEVRFSANNLWLIEK